MISAGLGFPVHRMGAGVSVCLCAGVMVALRTSALRVPFPREVCTTPRPPALPSRDMGRLGETELRPGAPGPKQEAVPYMGLHLRGSGSPDLPPPAEGGLRGSGSPDLPPVGWQVNRGGNVILTWGLGGSEVGVFF